MFSEEQLKQMFDLGAYDSASKLQKSRGVIQFSIIKKLYIARMPHPRSFKFDWTVYPNGCIRRTSDGWSKRYQHIIRKSFDNDPELAFKVILKSMKKVTRDYPEI